jgi:hypothetical protein
LTDVTEHFDRFLAELVAAIRALAAKEGWS